MDVSAKLTSKGQITVPQSVREALGLKPGDHVLFRVEENHALFARTPNFLDLAGCIEAPAGREGASWDEIREEAHRSLGEKYR